MPSELLVFTRNRLFRRLFGRRAPTTWVPVSIAATWHLPPTARVPTTACGSPFPFLTLSPSTGEATKVSKRFVSGSAQSFFLQNRNHGERRIFALRNVEKIRKPLSGFGFELGRRPRYHGSPDDASRCLRQERKPHQSGHL